MARFKEAADYHKSATNAYHKVMLNIGIGRYRKIEVDCAKQKLDASHELLRDLIF